MTTHIPADHPGFRYYGRWHPGPTAVTITNGAECEFAYTGDRCVLCFDTTAPGMVYPRIACWIDGEGPVRLPLEASGEVVITPRYHVRPAGEPPYPDVCSNRHHVRVLTNIESGYPVRNENWTTRRDAVRFAGARLAAGAALRPVPGNPRRIEFLGDSLTAGLGILYTAAGRRMADAAPELNWPELTTRLLGRRALVNGHGGQGITSPSTDGAPVAGAAFPYVYQGVPWQPAIPPETVVIYQGTNDAAVTPDQYAAYLRIIRAAYPAARLVAIAPNRTPHAPAIRAAVAAVADPRVAFLDYSAAFPEEDTNDGIHFNPGGAIHMGLRLADDLAKFGA